MSLSKPPFPEEAKAILLTGGCVRVPHDFAPISRISRSTAGPGAGKESMVFSFAGTRVRKSISRTEGEFSLVVDGSHMSIWWKGMPLAEEVSIDPILFHSPEQAFFNLDDRCVMGCRYCTASPFGSSKETISPEELVRRIVRSSREVGLNGVAITSGIPDSPEETIDRIAHVVREVRKALPDIPIGVEPYATSFVQIDTLHDAGADEIKLNIETYDRAIFKRVCGRKDLDVILDSIWYATRVFGRGRVSSNIIIGMGESDDNVRQGIEHLTDMGCIPTLRPLHLDPASRDSLSDVIDPKDVLDGERLLRLGRIHALILREKDLTPMTCKTMCHRCGACDIVPFLDVDHEK